MAGSGFDLTRTQTEFVQGDRRETYAFSTSNTGPRLTTQNTGARSETTTSGSVSSTTVASGTDTTTVQSKGDIALQIQFRLRLNPGLGSPIPGDYVSDPCA